jgi:hypothetical protein
LDVRKKSNTLDKVSAKTVVVLERLNSITAVKRAAVKAKLLIDRVIWLWLAHALNAMARPI